MEDIRDSGYWPTIFISESSPELPIHYHDYDIPGYVIEGQTYLLDENGVKIPIGPGRQARHSEGSVARRGGSHGTGHLHRHAPRAGPVDGGDHAPGAQGPVPVLRLMGAAHHG